MPEIILTCSRCGRQLRVPDELQGRMVKCPACEFVFTVQREEAPPPGPPPLAGGETEPPLLQGQPVAGSASDRIAGFPPTWEQEARRGVAGSASDRTTREQVQSSILAPAICVLVAALLGLLGSAYMVLSLQLQEEQVRAQVLRDLQQRQPGNHVAAVDLAMTIVKGIHLVSPLLSVIISIAMIQMLRLRSYWLAVMGSGLSLVNPGCCICLLGLPFGIWSLVVLLRPETRDFFQS